MGGVTQSVDPSGEVCAQVMYFKHAAPQFMIGVRTAWQPGKKKLRSLQDAGHFVDPTTGVAADTTTPSKAELHAAIAEVVALPGSAYTTWRQRLRRTLAKRRWAPHGFVGAAEFGPFLALYDTLMARFGVVADERFAAVLNGITKARRQRYNAAYQARLQDDATVVAQRLARAAYMRGYRSRPRTPEQQEAECAGRAPYTKRYRATRTEVG